MVWVTAKEKVIVEAILTPKAPLSFEVYRVNNGKERPSSNNVMPMGEGRLEETVEMFFTGKELKISGKREGGYKGSGISLGEVLSKQTYEPYTEGSAALSFEMPGDFFGPYSNARVIVVSHEGTKQTIIPIYCRGKEKGPSRILNVAGWPDFIIKNN